METVSVDGWFGDVLVRLGAELSCERVCVGELSPMTTVVVVWSADAGPVVMEQGGP